MADVSEHPNSLKLIQKMREASPSVNIINYKDFIQHALYDSECGYYTRDTDRVGRNSETDFYTSQSIGPIFGALVLSAIEALISENQVTPVNLNHWTFVEIGYEKDSYWWKPEACPFIDHIRIGPKDKIQFDGPCVVFSNELFDAQPFHRLVHIGGEWREIGVDLTSNTLTETILPEFSNEVANFRNQLPLHAEEGYLLDLPLATVPLIKSIVELDWYGLFLAIDYGKPWAQLAYDFPQGTARSYYRHKQSADLIGQPGMQDLTCHICWDWLENALRRGQFNSIKLENQEAFFVKHAAKRIESIISAKPGQFDEDRQSLMHLIHPATMGQKFQVLSGSRLAEFRA
jgi:SAM-dependent MidA family methyltransferase